MVRTVNIEVYCDTTEGEKDLFGVVSEHRSDLPKEFDSLLNEWVNEHFHHLNPGESISEAGEMKYVPNGKVVGINKTG